MMAGATRSFPEWPALVVSDIPRDRLGLSAPTLTSDICTRVMARHGSSGARRIAMVEIKYDICRLVLKQTYLLTLFDLINDILS